MSVVTLNNTAEIKMINAEILEEIKKIKSIAEIGLQYASSGYELERYTELQHISYALLSKVSGISIDELKVNLPASKDYPTAKVDIRGLLLKDDKVLLVKESADAKWSLPGGWADIGSTPKEVIIKEFKEETGIDVHVKSLLAVFDKRMHPHPPQSFYVYKMVFLCEQLSSAITKGFDVLDVGYFSVDDLPELSQDRILKQQIEFLYQRIKSGETESYFD
jgi:ADP-ribose pyrophosphatase YjhB (NUDIX family)